MNQLAPRTICVQDSSHIGEARRAVQSVAAQCKMTGLAIAHAAIVATELATNLFRYAPGGLFTMQWLPELDQGTLELLSIDTGPGIEDLSACMRDGYSTGGTAGNGLGAVQRLSTTFDIYTRPGQGTVVLSRIARGPARNDRAAETLRWGVRAFPIKGESVNGDSWSFASRSEGATFLVVDGLGHGPSAADAAAAITKAFDEDPWRDPTRLIEAAHRASTGSRGAAVAVAAVDWATMRVTYAGVGNIAGALLGPENATTGMVSHNGIVGAQVRKIQNFNYIWPAGGILVMHSDGLQTRWGLDQYPGIRHRHPAIIAALLARDFSRGRDDVTVLVATR